MFNKGDQVTLKGILKYEFTSLYGRLLLHSKPQLNIHGKNLLNLGCGTSKFKNWVNADFFQPQLRNLFRKKINRPDWMLDLRFSLNCGNAVWDGVFTEHTFEHLYPDQAQKLLKELYRTMKPGAWIRITVPDLRKYVDYYSGKNAHEKFNSWESRLEALRSLTQDYFHVSLWDNEFLEKNLIDSGFIHFKELSYMEGNDLSLLKDKKEREWETIYVEAQKPM